MADQKISQLTSKTTPVNADSLAIYDSENAASKQVTMTNLKAFLKTYFDGVYGTAKKEVRTPTGKTITLSQTPLSNTLIISVGGIFLTEGASYDYTVSTKTVTFAVAPVGTIVAHYRY